jgi:hypothetical protein
MNKLKFYKVAAISLLILNVILVSAFLITKPKGRPGGIDRLNVKDHFKMDESQHDLFLKNVEIHHEEMTAIKDKQLEIIKTYLYNIRNSQESDEQSATIQMIKDLEGRKLTSTYNHLNDLKNILKEEQLPLFDSFLKHRLDAMSKNDRNRKPHNNK